MGSGNRFTCGLNEGCGLGIYVARFPFTVTISINLLFWFVSLGFGRGYDEPEEY